MVTPISPKTVTNLYNLSDDQPRYKGKQKSILPLGKTIENESETAMETAATTDEDESETDHKKGVYIELFEKAMKVTSQRSEAAPTDALENEEVNSKTVANSNDPNIDDVNCDDDVSDDDYVPEGISSRMIEHWNTQ